MSCWRNSTSLSTGVQRNQRKRQVLNHESCWRSSIWLSTSVRRNLAKVLTSQNHLPNRLIKNLPNSPNLKWFLKNHQSKSRPSPTSFPKNLLNQSSLNRSLLCRNPPSSLNRTSFRTTLPTLARHRPVRLRRRTLAQLAAVCARVARDSAFRAKVCPSRWSGSPRGVYAG
uniref:(northern house mosquito) hypothetical protein n=1 Tax=Culex pipiens TaxID=7175 RepID=A0A8D8HN55_CULPI